MDKQTPAAPEVQPCLAIVLAHVSLAVLGTCRALSRVTEEPSFERRVLLKTAFLALFRLVVTRSIFTHATQFGRFTLNGETQLRLTASQTETVGAYFVEPGLKMNCEECIKVMDEYFVPNCAALVDPRRRRLLILDSPPSHARRLACEQYKTVLHCTVEFQSAFSPDLSPFDFFLWNEHKVQLVQHLASSNPAELRALLERVCRSTWSRQQRHDRE